MGKGIEKSCAKTAWGLGAGETAVEPVRACLHGGGGPRIGEVTCGRSPYLSCKRDQIKILPGVPHFHVNRPKDYCFQYVFPVYPMIDQLRQFTSTVTSIFWLLFTALSLFSLVCTDREHDRLYLTLYTTQQFPL